MSESVIVVDFGGQYNQLIARRVRECHVYSEIVPYTKALDVIKAKRPRGIIFTGGPNSAYEDGAPAISTEVFDLGIPVLGICYGAQLMMHLLGGHVCKAPVREYGKTEVFVDPASKLFADISSSTVCWMSHTDYIESVAPGFEELLYIREDTPESSYPNDIRKYMKQQRERRASHESSRTN